MRTFPHKKWNPFVQFDLHDGLFLFFPFPPNIAPMKGMHVGAGLLAFPFWGMGSEGTMNECRIFADGMEVVSRGHEPEHLIIPHLNLFPPPVNINLLIPLLIYGSSSKCFMASGSVVGTSGPIAISLFKYLGLNAACWDPGPVPLSLVVNWGTVEIGFSWKDLLVSLLHLALDIFMEWIIGKIADAIAEVVKGIFDDLIEEYLDDFIKKMDKFDDFAEDWIEENLPEAFEKLGDAIDHGEDFLTDGLNALFEQDLVVDWMPESIGQLGFHELTEFHIESTVESWFTLEAEPVP